MSLIDKFRKADDDYVTAGAKVGSLVVGSIGGGIGVLLSARAWLDANNKDYTVGGNTIASLAVVSVFGLGSAALGAGLGALAGLGIKNSKKKNGAVRRRRVRGVGRKMGGRR